MPHKNIDIPDFHFCICPDKGMIPRFNIPEISFQLNGGWQELEFYMLWNKTTAYQLVLGMLT